MFNVCTLLLCAIFITVCCSEYTVFITHSWQLCAIFITVCCSEHTVFITHSWQLCANFITVCCSEHTVFITHSWHQCATASMCALPCRRICDRGLGKRRLGRGFGDADRFSKRPSLVFQASKSCRDRSAVFFQCRRKASQGVMATSQRAR